MKILKVNAIELRERRLIRNLYMDQSIIVRLGQGEARNVKIRRGVRPGCCFSLIPFKLYSEYFTNEALEDFGTFKL